MEKYPVILDDLDLDTQLNNFIDYCFKGDSDFFIKNEEAYYKELKIKQFCNVDLLMFVRYTLPQYNIRFFNMPIYTFPIDKTRFPKGKQKLILHLKEFISIEYDQNKRINKLRTILTVSVPMIEKLVKTETNKFKDKYTVIVDIKDLDLDDTEIGNIYIDNAEIDLHFNLYANKKTVVTTKDLSQYSALDKEEQNRFSHLNTILNDKIKYYLSDEYINSPKALIDANLLNTKKKY